LWFRTLLFGLRAVHLRGFVHSSLKPSSVRWLRREGSTLENPGGVLVGFGASMPAGGGMPEIGVPRCTAPEVLLGQAASHASDMWACGVLLLQMVLGRPWLFPADHLGALVAFAQLCGANAVCGLATRYNARLKLPAWIPKEKDAPDWTMLTRALAPWQTPESPPSVFDLTAALVQLDPDGRIGAEEALAHPFFRHGFKGHWTLWRAVDGSPVTSPSHLRLISSNGQGVGGSAVPRASLSRYPHEHGALRTMPTASSSIRCRHELQRTWKLRRSYVTVSTAHAGTARR
jgi:serine/threonine protein kinase